MRLTAFHLSYPDFQTEICMCMLARSFAQEKIWIFFTFYSLPYSIQKWKPVCSLMWLHLHCTSSLTHPAFVLPIERVGSVERQETETHTSGSQTVPHPSQQTCLLCPQAGSVVPTDCPWGLRVRQSRRKQTSHHWVTCSLNRKILHLGSCEEGLPHHTPPECQGPWACRVSFSLCIRKGPWEITCIFPKISGTKACPPLLLTYLHLTIYKHWKCRPC